MPQIKASNLLILSKKKIAKIEQKMRHDYSQRLAYARIKCLCKNAINITAEASLVKVYSILACRAVNAFRISFGIVYFK